MVERLDRLLPHAVGKLLPRGVVGIAGLGGDRESGWHWQPSPRHLGDACPLASEQVTHVLVPLFEEVDPFLGRGRPRFGAGLGGDGHATSSLGNGRLPGQEYQPRLGIPNGWTWGCPAARMRARRIDILGGGKDEAETLVPRATARDPASSALAQPGPTGRTSAAASAAAATGAEGPTEECAEVVRASP